MLDTLGTESSGSYRVQSGYKGHVATQFYLIKTVV